MCGEVWIREGGGQVGLRWCGNHVWCGRVDRRRNHVLVVDGIGGWCRAVWIEVGLVHGCNSVRSIARVRVAPERESVLHYRRISGAGAGKLLKASAPGKGEWERTEGGGDCYRGNPYRGIGSTLMVRIARKQLDSRYPDGLVDVWLSGRDGGGVGGRLMKGGASPPK